MRRVQAEGSCKLLPLSRPDMRISPSLLTRLAAAQALGMIGMYYAGDVYRRDSIDQSHYPVFHQMEGVQWPPERMLFFSDPHAR